MAPHQEASHPKSEANILTPVGASPVSAVLGARVVTGQPGPHGVDTFTATSLPGHLLHYVLRGQVEQECNGRKYVLQPGTVLWYHEDEEVKGRVVQRPWDFISLHFVAPTLAPPPFEGRIWEHQQDTLPLFKAVVRAWNDPQGLRRNLSVHATFNALLLRYVLPEAEASQAPVPLPGPGPQLWWQLETALRRDLAQAVDLPLMEKMAHCSAASITRSCRQAVGRSPMKRLKEIRLSMARGLIQHSELSMTEISARIGYARVHEFSRDYKLHFGHAPSLEPRENG